MACLITYCLVTHMEPFFFCFLLYNKNISCINHYYAVILHFDTIDRPSVLLATYAVKLHLDTIDRPLVLLTTYAVILHL